MEWIISRRPTAAPAPPTLTCIQELLHHVEVGVWYTVMQGRVAVAVGHVGNVVQHVWGHVPEGAQVVLHHRGQRRLLAGNAEPFVLNSIYTGSLRRQEVEWGPIANEGSGILSEWVFTRSLLPTAFESHTWVLRTLHAANIFSLGLYLWKKSRITVIFNVPHSVCI